MLGNRNDPDGVSEPLRGLRNENADVAGLTAGGGATLPAMLARCRPAMKKTSLLSLHGVLPRRDGGTEGGGVSRAFMSKFVSTGRNKRCKSEPKRVLLARVQVIVCFQVFYSGLVVGSRKLITSSTGFEVSRHRL